MTLREQLENQIKKDIERNKKITLSDKNETQFTFDAERNIMSGKKDGKTWIKQIDSTVPAYWHYCPKVVGQNELGYDLTCSTPSLVFITDHGKDSKCVKCKFVSKIKLTVDPKSEAYKIFKELYKEG